MNKKTRHLYGFGPFRLDAEECLLLLDGKPLPLPPKAFEALLFLVENAGHLVDKDELMKKVRPDTFVEDGNVAKHVSLLRKILSEATNGRDYIETIPKRGYRLQHRREQHCVVPLSGRYGTASCMDGPDQSAV